MSERRHVAAEVADLIWADSPSGKRVLRCARLRRAPLRMTTGWALWSKKEEISVEVERQPVILSAKREGPAF